MIAAYWKDYRVQLRAEDRVLDGLLQIRRKQDSKLAFRASCQSGQCGADAMDINGVPGLACQTLIKSLDNPDTVVIRPLAGYPVKKDLVVDLEEIENSSETVLKTTNSSTDLTPDPSDTKELQAAAICNLCGCCDAACPVNWETTDFWGPARLLKLYRYQSLLTENSTISSGGGWNNSPGIWGCETEFNCIEVCPREINVTQLISRLKDLALRNNS